MRSQTRFIRLDPESQRPTSGRRLSSSVEYLRKKEKSNAEKFFITSTSGSHVVPRGIPGKRKPDREREHEAPSGGVGGRTPNSDGKPGKDYMVKNET
ncbi:hypothetical protein ZHAS_00015425 [Anopheles sinensis]|uniref:Uncharacterized protein n=1 Tax=Anopheles sinensis TaxID=74873 RepID=A0A084WB81_ANOSI|nr:hypothetical protein ZHAS_00015425 [Anopheles sinensis]